VNLKRLIEGSFKKANDWIKNEDITLRIHMDEKIHLVVDEVRLDNILYVLFSNAIQYSKPGKQYVDVYAMKTKDKLKINIEDNGIGINKDLISKVFEMYYRANSYSKGSGLGLYNVKEIIDKLEGKVEIESEEGVGTKVKLVIPCVS
jgi:signal transduction histidine kinase